MHFITLFPEQNIVQMAWHFIAVTEGNAAVLTTLHELHPTMVSSSFLTSTFSTAASARYPAQRETA
jgi:hypothetical protein